MMMMGGQLGTDPSSFYLQMMAQQAKPRQGYSYVGNMLPPTQATGAFYPTSPAPYPQHPASQADGTAAYPQHSDTFTAQAPQAPQAHMAPPVAHPPIAAEEASKGPNWLGMGTVFTGLALASETVLKLKSGKIDDSLVMKGSRFLGDAWQSFFKQSGEIVQAAPKAVDEKTGIQIVNDVKQSKALIDNFSVSQKKANKLAEEAFDDFGKQAKKVNADTVDLFETHLDDVLGKVDDVQVLTVLGKARETAKAYDSPEIMATLLKRYKDFNSNHDLDDPIIDVVHKVFADPSKASPDEVEKAITLLKSVHGDFQIHSGGTTLETLLTSAKSYAEASQDLAKKANVIKAALDPEKIDAEELALLTKKLNSIHLLSDTDLDSLLAKLKALDASGPLKGELTANLTPFETVQIAMKDARKNTLNQTHDYLDVLAGTGTNKGVWMNGVDTGLEGLKVNSVGAGTIDNHSGLPAPSSGTIEIPVARYTEPPQLSKVELDGGKQLVLKTFTSQGETTWLVDETSGKITGHINKDGEAVKDVLPQLQAIASHHQSASATMADATFFSGAKPLQEAKRVFADPSAGLIDDLGRLAEAGTLKNKDALVKNMSVRIKNRLDQPFKTEAEMREFLRGVQQTVTEGLGDSLEDRILKQAIDSKFKAIFDATTLKTTAQDFFDTSKAGSLGELIGKVKGLQLEKTLGKQFDIIANPNVSLFQAEAAVTELAKTFIAGSTLRTLIENDKNLTEEVVKALRNQFANVKVADLNHQTFVSELDTILKNLNKGGRGTGGTNPSADALNEVHSLLFRGADISQDVVKLTSDAKPTFINDFFQSTTNTLTKYTSFKTHITQQIELLEKAGKTTEAAEFKRIYQQLESISEEAFDTPVTKRFLGLFNQKVGTLTQGDVELNKVMFNYILSASDKAGGVRFNSAQIEDASQFLLKGGLRPPKFKIGNVEIAYATTLEGRLNNVLKADLNYSDFVRVFNQTLENLDPSEKGATVAKDQMQVILGYLTNPTAIPEGLQGDLLKDAIELLQKADTLPVDRARATKTLRTVLKNFANSRGTDLHTFLST